MVIAILGGGVAGISTAIALKQRGFDVRVYERNESASNIGAGIVIWPNAAFVLKQLGVLDEIANLSGRPTKMRRLTPAEEELGTIDIEALNQRMGYPSLSILRCDLQNILISKLESLGVTIQYNHRVENIHTDKQGQAVATFQNSARITPDVLIGADGRMASKARHYAYGDNTPIYQGFINWIGVYESERYLFKEIAVSDYWGRGKRFGIVPINEHKAYWAGAIASQKIGLRNSKDYKFELLSHFSDWPEPVQEMIANTPVRVINKIYVHDHDPIKTWHKNNLITIGDAAHAPLPTSGQGACQALEDAWHLTNCLNEKPTDIQAAFTDFTAIRYEKTTEIIHAARSFASSLFNRDEHFCRLRNQKSRETDFSQLASAMAMGWASNLPLGQQ